MVLGISFGYKLNIEAVVEGNRGAGIERVYIDRKIIVAVYVGIGAIFQPYPIILRRIAIGIYGVKVGFILPLKADGEIYLFRSRKSQVSVIVKVSL